MKTIATFLAFIIAGCSGVEASRLAEPVVVPFELRGDYALVRVEVNGHPTLLILDTGSGALVLDSAFARLAEVEWSRFMHGTAVGSGNTSVRIGNARSVRVGTAALSNVRVASVDIHDVQARVGYDVQGALGYELFESYVVAIDYQAKTITLHEPAEFQYTGSGVVVPLTFEHRLPVINASIVTRTRGTIPANLHLDLGSAAYALRLSSGFVTRNGIAHDTTTMAGIFGTGVGGTLEGQLLRIPQLRIGKLEINRPSTALSSAKEGAFGMNAATDGTIGVPVMRRSRLIIDYPHSRAILEPQKNFSLPDSIDASGLTLRREIGADAPIEVAYVAKGSAGDAAGIQPGDELLSIDGAKVGSPNPQSARDLLRSAGKTRQLVLRRGTDTLRVSLHLRMII
jgi:hypothetical protein